jgi:monoamine oxidase
MMRDVLILGGGLAGAAAALHLADRGLSSTIVEARGWLGGRALSRPLPGDDGPPVDYGGGWGAMHHRRLRALAARLGLALIPRAALLRHRYLREGAVHDTPCRQDESAAHAAAMARWQADAAEADPAILALTLAAYFDRRAMPESARREILAWWSISGAADPARAAVGQLLAPKIAKGLHAKLEELSYSIAGGAQGLVEGAARASGAEVILSDPAERLSAAPGGLRLRLASGRELAGRAAVVALPVNTLAQIRFDPPLPEAPARIRRRGHIGRVVKLLIRARGVAPGELASGDALGLRFFWADRLHPDGSTLVIAFALAVDLHDPSEAHARAALAQAFPEAGLVSLDWHDWQADPFARGVWVAPRAEDEPLHDARHWGPFGPVAFAGSDIAPEEQGWFEGALASAERAAHEVARHLATA